MYQFLPALLAASAISVALAYAPVHEGSKRVDDVLAERTVAMFLEMESAWDSYFNANSEPHWECHAEGGEEACARGIIISSLPSEDAWKQELFPRYGFRPQDIDGARWEYGSSQDGGIYVCLDTASASPKQQRALVNAKKTLPSDRFVTGVECGALPDRGTHNLPDNDAVYGTYWIRSLEWSRGVPLPPEEKPERDCTPYTGKKKCPPGWGDDFIPPGLIGTG